MISGHVCKDCGVNVIAAGELYMADLALWKRFGMTRWDAICVDCFEERLGRRLDPGDFITTPGVVMSERYRDRLIGRRCKTGLRIKPRRTSP